MDKNLPLDLFNRHTKSLGLENPLMIDNEGVLFEKRELPAISAVVFLPKSKALIDMTLAAVSGIVEKNGQVVLVGEKNAGIESAKKLYEKNIGPVDEKIVGNHSAMYVGRNKINKTFSIDDHVITSVITYKSTTLNAISLPGVFSKGELDPGTKLLLDALPIGASKFLDLACGSGVIGALYKKLSPETEVTLTDSSVLALESTRRTLVANGIDGKVVASDIFSSIDDVFDLIAVNPPFHKGIGTDYSFMEKFSKEASKFLLPEGKVFVVANTFLPYRSYLERIGEVREVHKDPQYIVYQVTRI